jgi:carbamoyltransferase
MYILGIWDGHDSGAAIIKDNEILVAINEERLTRRKLEIKFPYKSIQTCLNYLKIKHSDISEIAISTSDPAKTLARIAPSTKDEYYLIRRRKKDLTFLNFQKKKFKYKLTELKPNWITTSISKKIIQKELNKIGFNNYRLSIVDHHISHVAAAAFCSGFDESMVITLDGLGDGVSGTVNIFKDKKLKNISTISAKDSFGIFFEHVTNLMNMRELEDEGKVMALADYAYPISDKENPLLNFFSIEGLNIKARYNSLKMYKELKKILWKYPSEQFANMAQKTLEHHIIKLIQNIIKETGLNKIALSGGVASNVKVNMKIRNLPECEECFVFPHMGDGGLALGAAMYRNYQLNEVTNYKFDSIAFGLEYSNEEIENELKQANLNYKAPLNLEKETAELIAQGNIILWFQDRMEYGPRALGSRSILALPNKPNIKDELNLKLKKRVWYQPFCPSLLEEDAPVLLEDFNGKPNYFMTMAYNVRKEFRQDLIAVINIDGSCRPQILGKNNNSKYVNLLKEIKSLTGKGVLLNTSFNIHGEPLVCSPEDAIKTFLITGIKYLVIGNFIVTQ